MSHYFIVLVYLLRVYFGMSQKLFIIDGWSGSMEIIGKGQKPGCREIDWAEITDSFSASKISVHRI